MRSRHRYQPSYRYRLARLHLQPERIQEIQQALIQKGYLSGTPTGKWDDSTETAMRRFQEASGFEATGLPEAKALMQLGLGPHPLPPGVTPAAPSQANAGTNPPPNSNDPASGHSSAQPRASSSPPSSDHP